MVVTFKVMEQTYYAHLSNDFVMRWRLSPLISERAWGPNVKAKYREQKIIQN
jgi:hypothetical protein